METRGVVLNSGGWDVGRSGRGGNPFVGNLGRPRLLRLRVVGGDHAIRRIRCWNEAQFHTSTLGHVCSPRRRILPSVRLFTPAASQAPCTRRLAPRPPASSPACHGDRAPTVPPCHVGGGRGPS